MTIKDYIYPPRPELAFPKSGLSKFDNKTFLSQPKFNGTCAEIYLDKNVLKTMNRHGRPLYGFKIQKEEIVSVIQNEKLNLVVGEYMNMSKMDHANNIFNHKFVIFDILIFNGDYLLGKTFQERIDLLRNEFKYIDENDYSYKITNNIHMVKTFYEGFDNIWDKLVKIDMIEGLVLKRKNAGLEPGIRESNNSKSMLKCRKSTKNYSY